VTDSVTARRTLTVAALVAVLPVAAACGAGKNNETSKERATPYIPQARVGDLLVTNAALVPSGSSTTIGGAQNASTTGGGGGAQGFLVVTIANSGTTSDSLTGVTVANAQVSPSGGSGSSLTIKPQSVVQFVDPELGASGTALQVSGMTTPVVVGQSVPVTFTFRNGGSATIDVPVRATDDLGTTSTAYPLNLTGTYPTPTESVPVSSSPQASTSSGP
jgi:hypothetical protein